MAAEMFAERGYEATTLVQIADAASIAPSTLFTYYQSKADIVFSAVDEMLRHARRRIVDRPDGELATDALLAWFAEDIPAIVESYTEALLWGLKTVVGGQPELKMERRIRFAMIEDMIAEAYARDLGTSPDAVRPRVMATIALRADAQACEMLKKKRRSSEVTLEYRARVEARVEYVRRALENGAALIETLPAPE